MNIHRLENVAAILALAIIAGGLIVSHFAHAQTYSFQCSACPPGYDMWVGDWSCGMDIGGPYCFDPALGTPWVAYCASDWGTCVVTWPPPPPPPPPTCATNPTMDGCSCTISNACNSSSGTYLGGVCNAAAPAPCPPPPPVCSPLNGQSCSASNACGTNFGTYDCSGTCSASPPVCGPPPPTPGTVSCSPASQTIAAGGTASFTAVPAGGAGPAYTWYDSGNNLIGSGSPFSKLYASAGTYSVHVTANDGQGGTAVSGSCQVTVTGGGCSGAGPVNITATPTRVQSGSSATLNWTGSNLQGATCTITNTSTGATITTSPVSSCNVSGSINTGALVNQTGYTITCAGQTANVVVNVVPKFREF